MKTIALPIALSLLMYVFVGLLAVWFAWKAELLCRRQNESFVRIKKSVIYISRDRIQLLLCTLALSIPAVFRYGVGTDYLPYLPHAKNMANATSLELAINLRPVEDSFAFLSYYLGRFLEEPVLVFSFYAFATQCFVVFGIWKYRDRVSAPTAILVYYSLYYFLFYNIFRQGLAIAIVFWGIQYIDENKYFKFVIIVIIASLFHSTAILALGMLYYFRPYKKKNIVRDVIELLLPGVVLVAYNYIRNFIFTLSYFSKYAMYYDYSESRSLLTAGMALQGLFVAIFLWKTYQQNRRKNTGLNYGVQAKMLVCYLTVYMLGFLIIGVSRAALYYSFPAIIAFSATDKQYVFRAKRLGIYEVITIGFSMLFFVSEMMANGNGQLPYVFWLP